MRIRMKIRLARKTRAEREKSGKEEGRERGKKEGCLPDRPGVSCRQSCKHLSVVRKGNRTRAGLGTGMGSPPQTDNTERGLNGVSLFRGVKNTRACFFCNGNHYPAKVSFQGSLIRGVHCNHFRGSLIRGVHCSHFRGSLIRGVHCNHFRGSLIRGVHCNHFRGSPLV